MSNSLTVGSVVVLLLLSIYLILYGFRMLNLYSHGYGLIVSRGASTNYSKIKKSNNFVFRSVLGLVSFISVSMGFVTLVFAFYLFFGNYS